MVCSLLTRLIHSFLKEAVAALQHVMVDAPVHIGDLVYEDPAMELTLLASRNVEKA